MIEKDEQIQVKVSSSLLKKLMTKLNLNPDMPAVYVVDTALRQLLED